MPARYRNRNRSLVGRRGARRQQRLLGRPVREDQRSACLQTEIDDLRRQFHPGRPAQHRRYRLAGAARALNGAEQVRTLDELIDVHAHRHAWAEQPRGGRVEQRDPPDVGQHEQRFLQGGRDDAQPAAIAPAGAPVARQKFGQRRGEPAQLVAAHLPIAGQLAAMAQRRQVRRQPIQIAKMTDEAREHPPQRQHAASDRSEGGGKGGAVRTGPLHQIVAEVGERQSRHRQPQDHRPPRTAHSPLPTPRRADCSARTRRPKGSGRAPPSSTAVRKCSSDAR